MMDKLQRLKSWEGFLLLFFLLTVVLNSTLDPAYLRLDNWINLFELSIEKIIVAALVSC